MYFFFSETIPSFYDTIRQIENDQSSCLQNDELEGEDIANHHEQIKNLSSLVIRNTQESSCHSLLMVNYLLLRQMVKKSNNKRSNRIEKIKIQSNRILQKK